MPYDPNHLMDKYHAQRLESRLALAKVNKRYDYMMLVFALFFFGFIVYDMGDNLREGSYGWFAFNCFTLGLWILLAYLNIKELKQRNRSIEAIKKEMQEASKNASE